MEIPQLPSFLPLLLDQRDRGHQGLDACRAQAAQRPQCPRVSLYELLVRPRLPPTVDWVRVAVRRPFREGPDADPERGVPVRLELEAGSHRYRDAAPRAELVRRGLATRVPSPDLTVPAKHEPDLVDRPVAHRAGTGALLESAVGEPAGVNLEQGADLRAIGAVWSILSRRSVVHHPGGSRLAGGPWPNSCGAHLPRVARLHRSRSQRGAVMTRKLSDCAPVRYWNGVAGGIATQRPGTSSVTSSSPPAARQSSPRPSMT